MLDISQPIAGLPAGPIIIKSLQDSKLHRHKSSADPVTHGCRLQLKMMVIIIMKIDLIRITITAWSSILQITFSLLGTLSWDSDAATPVKDDDD